MEKQERKREDVCDEPAWVQMVVGRGQRTNSNQLFRFLYHNHFEPLSDLSRFLPAAEGYSDATPANFDPRASKVNPLCPVTGRLRDDGRVGVVDARESRQR
jgi:hypothetical protein